MTEMNYETLVHKVSEYGEGEMPGHDVMNWANLKESECKELAEMNDNGSEFEEIANYIEERL